MHPSNPTRTTAFLLIIMAASAFVMWKSISQTRFHPDESGWIISAMRTTGLILDGDFSETSWRMGDLGPWGHLNPPVGKYLLGFGLRAHPLRKDIDSEYRYRYHYLSNPPENRLAGRMPPHDLLIRARSVNALFTIVLFAVLSLTAALYTRSLIVGGIAWVLTVSNPLILIVLSRAMTDAYYNLFLLLLVIAILPLVHDTTSEKPAMWLFGAGSIAGLACAVKITGIVVGAELCALVLLYHSLKKRRTPKEYASYTAIFFVAALIVIYGVNPYFWPTQTFQSLLRFPMLFIEWSDLFQEFKGNSFAGHRVAEIHKMFFGKFMLFPFEQVFFAIGFGYGIRHLITSISLRRPDALGALVLIALAHYVFVLVLVQQNFPRYYLPAVLVMKMISALGAYRCAQWLAARATRPLRSPDSVARL